MEQFEVGSEVHYVTEDGTCRLAEAERVDGYGAEEATLAVLREGDDRAEDGSRVAFRTRSASYSEGREPGTWHWPEGAGE